MWSAQEANVENLMSAKAADAKLKAEKAKKEAKKEAIKEAKDDKDGKAVKDGQAGGIGTGSGELAGDSDGGKAVKGPKIFFADDADVEERSKKPLPLSKPITRKIQSWLTYLILKLKWEAVRAYTSLFERLIFLPCRHNSTGVDVDGITHRLAEVELCMLCR